MPNVYKKFIIKAMPNANKIQQTIGYHPPTIIRSSP